MLGPFRRLLRKISNWLAAPYMGHLAEQSAVLGSRVDSVGQQVDGVGAEVREVRRELAAAELRSDALDEEVALLKTALRHCYEEEAAQRRRLQALRRSEDYALAFTEENPLVSFIVPTYNRFERLRDVSLPSILGQSYSNLEVIVVGDGAPPETAEVIAELDDPRLRYYNRSVRGPYPKRKERRWYVLGTPPYNDALGLVRGRWIAGLGDDDAIRPAHTETLVRAAQAGRHELCYGRILMRYRNGEDFEAGRFPPEMGQFALQTSLYHAGLSFFELEPADYINEEPNDWSLCRRMLAAGVRFGMVDDLLADKYEERYESPEEWGIHGIPTIE